MVSARRPSPGVRSGSPFFNFYSSIRETTSLEWPTWGPFLRRRVGLSRHGEPSVGLSRRPRGRQRAGGDPTPSAQHLSECCSPHTTRTTENPTNTSASRLRPHAIRGSFLDADRGSMLRAAGQPACRSAFRKGIRRSGAHAARGLCSAVLMRGRNARYAYRQCRLGQGCEGQPPAGTFPWLSSSFTKVCSLFFHRARAAPLRPLVNTRELPRRKYRGLQLHPTPLVCINDNPPRSFLPAN